jgi:hypothetical protein
VHRLQIVLEIARRHVRVRDTIPQFLEAFTVIGFVFAIENGTMPSWIVIVMHMNIGRLLIVPPAVAVLVAVWTFTEGWLLRHFGLLLCYLIIVLFVKWFVFGFFGFFLVRFGFLVFFRFACSI